MGKLVERLQAASDEELTAMPGAVVYTVEDLQSSVCKRVPIGAHPDIIVTTTDGKRKKYGLGNGMAFDAVADALRGCYGGLVQRPCLAGRTHHASPSLSGEVRISSRDEVSRAAA